MEKQIGRPKELVDPVPKVVKIEKTQDNALKNKGVILSKFVRQAITAWEQGKFEYIYND